MGRASSFSGYASHSTLETKTTRRVQWLEIEVAAILVQQLPRITQKEGRGVTVLKLVLRLSFPVNETPRLHLTRQSTQHTVVVLVLRLTPTTQTHRPTLTHLQRRVQVVQHHHNHRRDVVELGVRRDQLDGVVLPHDLVYLLMTTHTRRDEVWVERGLFGGQERGDGVQQKRQEFRCASGYFPNERILVDQDVVRDTLQLILQRLESPIQIHQQLHQLPRGKPSGQAGEE